MNANNYSIRDLKIPDDISKDYSTKLWPHDRITKLSRLNVFIGPNNSGKSRLLRRLFADESMSYVPNLAEAIDVNESIGKLFIYVNENIDEKDTREWLFENLNKFRTPSLVEKSHKVDDFTNERKVLDYVKRELVRKIHGEERREIRTLISKVESNLENYKRIADNEKFNTTFKKIYIPALRGLRPPQNDKEFYRNRTHSDYFKDVKRLGAKRNMLTDFEILTGLELYDEIKKHLLGDLRKRQIISDYQNFIGKAFFKGEKVVLIPRIDSDVLYVKIGNEHELPVYKLGDGIQQLLILTIPMFIHRDKQLLMYIEEPELYMHPGFQRLFIDTVLSNGESENRQVFVATHSSQFLDITIDETSISVFKIKKELPSNSQTSNTYLPKFKIINTSNDDFTLLAELGIRNSSIMLANCTIWVEGITDRIYLRKYLEIYQTHNEQVFMEDLHYSFVEYGGANLVHWSFSNKNDESIFALRISNNIFLIKDKDAGKNTLKHTELLRSLGDKYHRLTSKEIENLLSPEVLKKIIRDYEGDDVKISDFKKTDYRDDYLGRFIEDIILNGHGSKKYQAASGTIRDKVNFAQKAIKHIETRDDISDEAWNLAEKVYNFIKQSQ